MTLRIAFVGSGRVNFGGGSDPWDHASRVEIISREVPLEVVAIVDINSKLSEKVLKLRLEKTRPQFCRKIWEHTKIYSSVKSMLDVVSPDAVWIGIPPFAHGDIECTLAKAGIHMFIEKPISCAHPCVVESVRDEVANVSGIVVSVGYMLRYCQAVHYVQKFILENKLTPVSILARYNTAYPSIPSPMWWSLKLSGGPIIEQATHFCDLLRLFGGEVDFGTISAISVSARDVVGKLSKVPDGVEDNVREKHRITRAVNATWKFKNGAIGALSHGALMHGMNYHTQFEIWCDGYRILLHDPYTSDCHVLINEKKIDFPKDDMYLTEDIAFVRAILTKDPTLIQSSYQDAVETYKLSWSIAKAARLHSEIAKL